MFKKGDKVRCVNNNGQIGLVLNEIYTIYNTVNHLHIGNFVQIVGDSPDSIYLTERFVKDNREEKLRRILK